VQKFFVITKFFVILALTQQAADLAIADEQRRATTSNDGQRRAKGDVHQLYVIVLARRRLKRKAGPLPWRRTPRRQDSRSSRQGLHLRERVSVDSG
jgi:hypothetical protein